MNGWGNIGRPLVITITVALVSMTAVSSFLVSTAQQATEARIEQAASQTLRENLANESMQASKAITFGLENVEKALQASASLIDGISDDDAKLRTIRLTQSSIAQYTNEVVWLDAQGKLLFTTKNDSADLVGADLSGRRFYELPFATHASAVIQSPRGVNGTSSFAISVPILSHDGSFGGVLAALVPVDSVRKSFLQTGGFDKSLILIAKDGTILVHPLTTLEGRQIVGSEMANVLTEETRDATLRNLQLMEQGRSGIADYHEKGGEASLMAYEPVVVGGEYTWSVAVLQPTSTIRTPFIHIFEERQSFTVIATGLIAAVSGIFIAFILILNRRLFTTVSQQDTKIKDNLQDLKAAYERLREQDIIKDEFINIAAHELRTPVLPIVLSAENLADKMPEDENIRIILRNANRITKLTNDILDASRIESNTFKLQKQKISIRKLIEEVIQDAELKIPRQQSIDIVLESTMPPAMDELAIDRSRINQVLVNLVDNAINFTENGTIKIVLEPDKETPGYLRISVMDSGTGIDSSVKERLFGKFVSKSNRAKGTGLGLYLCKAIVEAHGGKIWGENNSDGKGATFTFTLPAL